MQRQRMRIGPNVKLQWKVVAVLGAANPDLFAERLEHTLQNLTDQGFAINGQLVQDDALIISASRLPSPDTATLRRRVVSLPSSQQAGTTHEDVLYHYTENGAQKQRSFPVLTDALRALKEDLTRPEILPLNITTVSMTRFEPEAFANLLRMFAEDLQPSE